MPTRPTEHRDDGQRHEPGAVDAELRFVLEQRRLEPDLEPLERIGERQVDDPAERPTAPRARRAAPTSATTTRAGGTRARARCRRWQVVGDLGDVGLGGRSWRRARAVRRHACAARRRRARASAALCASTSVRCGSVELDLGGGPQRHRSPWRAWRGPRRLLPRPWSRATVCCQRPLVGVGQLALPGRDDLFLVGIGVAVPLTEEGHEDLARHVERGQQRGDEADDPQPVVVVPGVGEDLVLRPEAGERRHAGDGQPADDERRRR